MQTRFNALILVTFSIIMTGCAATTSAKSENTSTPVPTVTQLEKNSAAMRVATWNVEHLAYPFTEGCKPRSAEEIAALKKYAQSLDANIIGLQEVASEQAVRQLFPEDEWQVIMSARPDSESYECRENGFTSSQQKVAYAVRKGIVVKKVTQLSEIALDNPGLRYGLAITVDTPLGETEILNLHLKSGCFVDDYNRKDSDACQKVAKQVPVLQNIVEKYELSGKPYVVLGDFNHRLTAPYNRMTRMLKSSAKSLSIASQYLIGCHPWYPAPIDNIVVGNTNPEPITKSVQVFKFEDMTVENMLSDHCAVSVDIQPVESFLSRGLTWVQTSKEFELMTLGIYQRAEKSLDTLDLPENNWVVVMDVDETVLDNSDYEKLMIARGTSYASDTWDIWVASEQATLVPGAKAFIDKVFAKGGKVAFVTNREKVDDDHTWNNMRAVGISVTPENSCLIGRGDIDVKSVEKPEFINDKDLRRQQIRQGTADCFAAVPSWQAEHTIVMQVGDNIKDIEGITQAGAVPAELLPRLDKDIIILLNPTYGSW